MRLEVNSLKIRIKCFRYIEIHILQIKNVSTNTLHEPLIFLSKAWVQQALTKKLGTFGVIGKKKISKFGKDMHEFLVMVTTGFLNRFQFRN